MVGGTGQQVGAGSGEQLAAQGELFLAMTVGQEPAVADALETIWQHVQQEAAEELVGGNRHLAGAVLVAIVFPLKGDLIVMESEQALIGDGDPVSVAAKVGQRLLGAAERGLGIDDPLGLAQRSQVLSEGGSVGERQQGAEEVELAVVKGGLESLQEEAAEESGEDFDGEKETGAAADPALVVAGQAAAGDDAMHMGVMQQVLSPGVEDGKETEPGAEVFGVGGEGEQGGGAGAKQEVIDELGVLQSEVGQRGGKGEHDVEVGDGQQFGFPAFDPLGARQSLALWAMPVTAGVIADASSLAVVALLDVAAQGRRAAGFDGAHHPQLMARQAMGLAVGGTVTSKNVGHLQRRP